MTIRLVSLVVLIALAVSLPGCSTRPKEMNHKFEHYVLDYGSPADPKLQAELETIDTTLRAKYGMTSEQTEVGLLDLNTLRLAMIHPDREEYAASVPKIGILFAYFQLHPEAATNLNAQTRHELGLMTKASNNDMAAKFSRELGLKQIQAVLNSSHFYDTNHGGGIWVGKHSHAATVRQLIRFFLMLEQGKLVSPAASKTMRNIFKSPEIPHDDIKIVMGLAGRDVQIIRKWGSWEDWFHDAAV